MSANQPTVKTLPLALRLAGCWLLWSAWCSLTGWGLSAINHLDGRGHLAALPILIVAILFWLKSTVTERNEFSNITKWRRRFFRPAPLIYLTIVGLSLLAALVNPNPWSFDSSTYRLPRILYWWSAHHWFWIGTLDHRLDYSSVGFELQMLPLIELTHSDRFLFLLNWLPLLLMPALVFLVFRACGVNGRSARRWMWLLPTGYCFALQSSGLQNDGYAVNYLLAAIAFAACAFHSRRSSGLWFALLAAALLTGAKVSNLPLLLPLGVFLLPALTQVKWLNWKIIFVALLAAGCSFLPMAYLSWEYTGDWAGDSVDQWGIKTHGVAGAVAANLILLAKDAAQLPYFPGSQHVNAILTGFNQSHFVHWLEQAHWQFMGVHFGEMVYEGPAGPGFGLAFYVLFLLAAAALVKTTASAFASTENLPRAWRIAPWLAWIAYAVYLAKLGSDHSPRIAAAYYPLLLITLLRWPRVAAVERKKISGVLAGCAAATLIPVIILTPARPLIPIQTLARVTHNPAIGKIAEQYHFWDYLRDDLAPLREQLPPDANCVGFAGGFHDTAYGLWKPFGSRDIIELGVPAGPHAPLPPADLKYAVVTTRGLSERYNLSLNEWLSAVGGQIIFEYPRNVMLDAHSAPKYESWYLVKLNPAQKK